MDYNPPGSSLQGILQARILLWVAMPSSRGSSQPRDQNTHHSPTSPALASRFFTRFKFIYTCLNESKLLSRNRALVHNQKHLTGLRAFLFGFAPYVLGTHTLILQTWKNSLAQIPSPVWKEIIWLSLLRVICWSLFLTWLHPEAHMPDPESHAILYWESGTKGCVQGFSTTDACSGDSQGRGWVRGSSTPCCLLILTSWPWELASKIDKRRRRTNYIVPGKTSKEIQVTSDLSILYLYLYLYWYLKLPISR